FTGDDALGLNLHPALGEDHAIVAASDDHFVAFDLAFDLGVFTEDQRLLRNDVAFHGAVHAERSFDRDGAFERNALINESCPLFVTAAAGAAGPLPRHNRTSYRSKISSDDQPPHCSELRREG